MIQSKWHLLTELLHEGYRQCHTPMYGRDPMFEQVATVLNIYMNNEHAMACKFPKIQGSKQNLTRSVRLKIPVWKLIIGKYQWDMVELL